MDDLQAVLHALASPVRREILWRIWDDELPAGEIAAAFDLTAPTISEHLAVLREAGLVTQRVDGSFRRYRARQEALRGLPAQLVGEGSKWQPADDLPEAGRAAVRTAPAVVATVDLAVPPSEAFAALTEADRFSAWLGVPVTLDGGRFATTLEWGTHVRGTYDHVVAPHLVALRWDFDDDAVPVPGRELPAYVRVEARRGGSRVTVHQLVETDEEAAFMETAWGLVLGRLAAGLEGEGAPARRSPRPKRRSTPPGS